MTHTQAEIAYTAKQLKTAFVLKKSQIEKRPYRPHKRFDDAGTWLKIAAVVLRMKANPDDYIAAQFRGARSTVYANTLHGPIAQKKYREWQVSICYDKADVMPTPSEEEMMKMETPSKAELISRIDYFRNQLVFNVQSADLSLPKVYEFVAERHYLFDPLVVMIESRGANPTLNVVYAALANDALDADPHFRAPAIELGYPA